MKPQRRLFTKMRTMYISRKSVEDEKVSTASEDCVLSTLNPAKEIKPTKSTVMMMIHPWNI